MISPKTQELIDKYPEIIEQNLKKWLSVALFELKLKESHKEVIAAFVEFYEQKKGVKYRFNGGKDGNATKAIILGIRHQWNQTHGEEPTKENILVAFRWMLDNLPPWVFDNLSLSVFKIPKEVASFSLTGIVAIEICAFAFICAFIISLKSI